MMLGAHSPGPEPSPGSTTLQDWSTEESLAKLKGLFISALQKVSDWLLIV